MDYAHAASGLLKATWTKRDNAELRWRGCTVHAIHIGEYEDNRVRLLEDGTYDNEFDDLDDTVAWNFLHLDIDYIVSRSEPETPGQEPAFWIAPATLDFSLASGIVAEISDGSADPVRLPLGTTTTNLVMSEVRQVGPDGKTDPLWRITGEKFDIRLYNTGFWLYIRAEPQLVHRPSLEMAERGGISFDERAFA